MAQTLDIVRWREIDALFAEVMDRSLSEQTAILRARCGSDAELYAEVVRLLELDQEAASVLKESAADFASPLLPGLGAALDHGEAAIAGQRVGRYRIERLIGRGGMGNVYLAVRDDGSFRKRVALKLVRRGLDSEDLLARFRQERQLLASLEHPNIARLLDGGLTDDGLPFLVMEYVEGAPITEHCDERTLGLDERLDLFDQVCRAVEHAHRHLVVHRDLKPSNILVSPEGDVKLLDFGIAKVVAGEAMATEVHTRENLRLVTPEYGAPEQLRDVEVTTSADVYSLGVVLYELLAGCRPYDLRGLDAIERTRIIAEVQPPRPSAAVTEAAASRRGTDPHRLTRRLRGDLDQIVLMALRKEPERRYSSVEALRSDLQRHAGRLPVQARPERTLYRASRFVARHRAGVAGTAALVAVLIAALVAVSLSQREAVRARVVAESELAQREEVTAFLTNILGAADPAQSRGDTLTVFDILATATARLYELDDRPEVQSHLMHILSDVYDSLGDLETSLHFASRALEVRKEFFGPRHMAVAESHNRLGSVLESRGDFESAEVHLLEALDIRRAAPGGIDEPLAESLLNLGLLYSYTGRYDEAEPLMREALAIDRARLGDTHEHVATALNNLAVLLFFKGDYGAAEVALREALVIRRDVYGDPHPRVAVTLNNLAAIVNRQGDLNEAERLFGESLQMTRSLVGAVHPDVASTLSNLAAVIGESGRHAEAEALLREAVEIHRATHGEHPQLADALGNLGSTLLDLGRLDEAEAAFTEALELNASTRGDAHPRVALSRYHLARVAEARGAFADAEAQYRAALAHQEQGLPPGHDEIANTLGALGRLLAGQGRAIEARPLLERSYEALLVTYGANDHRVTVAAELLAGLPVQPTAAVARQP